MSRKNAAIAFSHEGSTIAFTIAGVAQPITVDLEALSNDIREQAMIHGLRQKIADGAAIPKDELTGDAEQDNATKAAAMRAIAERLIMGEWSARKGDGSSPVSGVIALAFARWVQSKSKKPIPADEARAMFERRCAAIAEQHSITPRAAMLRIGAVPEIAEIVEQIKAERGPKASAISADDLLADLGI